MNVARLSIHALLAGMLAIPLIRTVETSLEASSIFSSGYQADLLLNQPVERPPLDRLTQLDHLVIADYTVGRNEDVWSICHKYRLDQFAIRSSNDLEENPASGTVLKIPNHNGTLYTVKSPESLHAITSGYEAGRKGGISYERDVLAFNGFPMPMLQEAQHPFSPGTVLFLPSAYKPTGLPIPINHFRLTSGYSLHRKNPVTGIMRPHHGMDLAKPYGSPVYPSRAGTVTYAGWMGGYGNLIEIRHVLRNGKVRYTLYGHLSAILVHNGQRVKTGQLIGRVGSTGNSTGPHLHFEVRDEEGQARNPAHTM